MVRSSVAVGMLALPLLWSSAAGAAESTGAPAAQAKTKTVAEATGPKPRPTGPKKLLASVPAAPAPPAATLRTAPPPATSTRSAEVADPWLTRATVTTLASASYLDAGIPLAEMNDRYHGRAPGGGLAIDLFGRALGFHLSLLGGGSRAVTAPVPGVTDPRFTTGEARAAITGVVANRHGAFVSFGPAVEARAAAVGHFEQGNEAVATWQSVVGGADLRGRVLASPRLYLTGSAFAGGLPLSGGWQSVDAARVTPSQGSMQVMQAAELTGALVVSATASASYRAAEWAALSAGLSARAARYAWKNDGRGHERSLRPFLALELLY